MAENSDQYSFVKALKVSTFKDGFSFHHDYGEKYFTWDSISHIFAVVYEKKSTLNLPFCIFLCWDAQSFYCIDGNTTQIRDADGKTSQKKQYKSIGETRKAKEDDLNKIIEEICMHSQNNYIDKPLVKYLQEGTGILPTFSSIKEVTGYCQKIMESLSKSDFRGALVFQSPDESPEIRLAPKMREQWKEGMVIEGQFTVQKILRDTGEKVYIIFDSAKLRYLAIKPIFEERPLEESVIKRFVMEAHLWLKIGQHPHIVAAETIREIEGRYCILLQYVRGRTLEQTLKNGALPGIESIQYALQLCAGLDYSWQKAGIMNRDIRPARCIISPKGLLKIADLATEKIFLEVPAGGNIVALPQQTGQSGSPVYPAALAVTIPYVAPELFLDFRSAGIKSDIYTLGIILYEMCTGTNPFLDSDPKRIMMKHLKVMPEDPSLMNPRVPEALDPVIVKCLQKNPEDRYGDLQEILAELEGIYSRLTGRSYGAPVTEETLTGDDWISLGHSLASLGRHKEAILNFDKAISLDRTFIDAWLSRAHSLMELGKTREAYATLSQALTVDAGNWRIYHEMAEAQWETGNLDHALACLDAGLQQKGQTVQLLDRKVKIFIDAGRFEEALIDVDKFLKLDTRNVTALFRRAELLLYLGYYEDCSVLCRAIRKFDPDHEDSLLLLNSVTAMLNERGVVLETIHSLAAFDREFILKDLNTLLSVFCNIKDALSYLECLDEEPKVEYLRACLYFTMGNREKCLNILDTMRKPKSAIGDDGTVDMDKYLKGLKDSLREPETWDASIQLKKFVEDLIESESHPPEEEPELPDSPIAEKKKELSLRAQYRTPELMLLHGLEKLNKGKGKEARDLFKMALTVDPHLTACGYFVGKTIEHAGDLKTAIIAYNEFINNFPNSIGYWKEMLTTQDITQATDFEKVYHRLLGVFPRFHHYWLSYILYLSENSYSHKPRVIASYLLDNFEEKLDIPDKTALFWDVKGLLQLYLGRHRRALQSFQEALRRDGEDLTALTGLWKSYMECGHLQGVETCLRKIKGLDEDMGLHEYFFSEQLRMQGEDKKALAAIEAGVKKNPGNTLLLTKKAQILLDRGDYDDLFKTCTRILSLDAAFAPARILCASALVECQKSQDALGEITRIISGDPGNLAAHKNLGFVHIYLNQPSKALNAFESIKSIYNNDHEVHMGKGISHYLMGDYNLSLECFLQALAFNTTDNDLWQFTGAVHFALGNFAESAKCWDRALKCRGGFPRALINKGYFLYCRQKFDEALELANRAIRISQKNVFAWILRAQCQWKMGNLGEALQDIDRATSISYESPKALIVKGILEFHNKNYEQSYQSLEHACALDSKNARVWYNKAMASLFMKNFEEARRSLDRSSTLNRFSKAHSVPHGVKAEGAKKQSHCTRTDTDFFDELVIRYAVEKESGADAAARTFYEQARQADPERFQEWASHLEMGMNPLDLLNPQDTTGDPFALRINHPLVKIEPLEVFHYLSIRELFAEKQPVKIEDADLIDESGAKSRITEDLRRDKQERLD